MTLNVVFDLDGTLGNTEPLVIKAYELNGIKVPKDMWGKPASAWLPQLVGSKEKAAEIHHLKNVAYRVLVGVEGVPPLAAADLCRELLDVDGYEVGILTGASFDATTAVRRALRLDRVPILAAGCELQRKIEVLQNLSKTGIYFDDNLEACECVLDETKWEVLYIEQAATDDILRGFKEAVTRCKQ